MVKDTATRKKAKSLQAISAADPSLQALARIETDKTILPHRYSLPSDQDLYEQVRNLKYLAGYETSPANPNSMSMKDDSARKALRLAGELIGPLVRWAGPYRC
jgi:hypothetical protein